MALKVIDEIRRKLDQAHNTDRDYLPRHLHELRTYILQTHAGAEADLEYIIWSDYLRSSKNLTEFGELFSRMSFFDKLRIVRELHQDAFPCSEVYKLNELRNIFAHQKSDALRSAYAKDRALVEAYEQLEHTLDALNNYWADRYGIE
jgi:hypothetical protein